MTFTEGRFENCALTYREKHAIILRNCDSYFTKLLVLDAHGKVLHRGIETTLSYIRSHYWIIKGKKSGRTNNYAPSSPDLPDYRVNRLIHSFQATGLDFAGPLFIRDIHIKDCLKVYTLLLTSASSLTIHLQLVVPQEEEYLT